MNRLQPLALVAVLIATSMAANAQFKVVGPPPFSPTVARQKIRTLVEQVDAANRQQTIGTLSGLLTWYRDIIDDELIAGWRKDTRANLTDVVESLVDSRVATGVVNFSWREQRQAAFNLTTAPMLGHLMSRFPESSKTFLDDLLSKPTQDLTDSEAEAVCRILMDMPDIGTWKNSALQILPHYRKAAERLLAQDVNGSDQEKSYQAQRWLAVLKSDVPGIVNEPSMPRRRPLRSSPPVVDRTSNDDRTVHVLMPSADADRGSLPTTNSSLPARPPVLPEPAPTANSPSNRPTILRSPAAPAAPPYTGPHSGTLESSGNNIPQNAEYVFRNLPAGKLQLDYDTKIWDARLAPGDSQTQRLIVKNKSSGPQKRCVVHWSVIP